MISLEQKQQLETNLVHWEKSSTLMAMVPIFGTIPAIAKMLLGIVQLVMSIAVVVLSSIQGIYDPSYRDLFIYSSYHALHGVANIISGIAFAIPIIGAYVAAGTRACGCFCCCFGDDSEAEFFYKYPAKLPTVSVST